MRQCTPVLHVVVGLCMAGLLIFPEMKAAAMAQNQPQQLPAGCPPPRPPGPLPEAPLQQIIDQLANMGDKLAGLESKLGQLKEDVAVLTPPESFRPAYRIFLEESPLGNYRLTLDDARELCASKKMKLATVTQMEAAFRQGLDQCSCGWIADGTARYAVQWPEDWCGGGAREAGIRFCEWQNTWNAYCFDDASLRGTDGNE